MADDIKYDVELDLKSFKKSKKELDNSFKKTQKNAKDMSGNMTKGFNASSIAMAGMAGGAIALSTAIAGGVTMTKKLVEESGALEDSKITWEQLTGSVIEAEKRIKSLRNFSDRTPFTFKGVDSASQSLYNLSNGILSTEADLQLLGDASAKGRQKIDEMAVTWGRLYQKLSSGDKAFGDEINRMAELGIITGETKKEIQAKIGRAHV